MHIAFIVSYMWLSYNYEPHVELIDNKVEQEGYDPDHIYWGNKAGKDFDQQAMVDKYETLQMLFFLSHSVCFFLQAFVDSGNVSKIPCCKCLKNQVTLQTLSLMIQIVMYMALIISSLDYFVLYKFQKEKMMGKYTGYQDFDFRIFEFTEMMNLLDLIVFGACLINLMIFCAISSLLGHDSKTYLKDLNITVGKCHKFHTLTKSFQVNDDVLQSSRIKELSNDQPDKFD